MKNFMVKVMINKKYFVIVISLLIVFLVWFVCDYLKLGSRAERQGEWIGLDDSSNEIISDNSDYVVEEYIRNLEVPWSLVFTSKDRLLIAERKGEILAFVNDELNNNPLYVLTEISLESEEGLMGMDKDPNYEFNKYLYICYAYQLGNTIQNKVVRLIDNQNEIVFDKVLIDGIPAYKYHAGCEVKVGPDDKLYVTTGDASDRQIAQDLASLGGKILRMNLDGSIPEDNPFGNSYVYSYGHRNSHGITWDDFGYMWASEHGPSGFDGPGGGDEINLIRAGTNYGWPIVSHEKTMTAMESPKLVFTPAVAPGSIVFYNSPTLSQFNQNLFFGALRGEGLYRLIIENDVILSYQKMDMKGLDVGRVREVVVGPDGYIYFTSSNRDGRGKTREGDDKVYRIRM